MHYDNLSDFLSRLEELGELQRVSAEVDPKYEMGAICRKLNMIGGPAVLFENVRGSNISVVSQLLASNRRLAIALDSSEEDLFEEVSRRSKQFMPPNLISHAPCQEVVKYGDEVDITELPLAINNPGDGGFYITAGHVLQKDQELGHNLAIYRIMRHSRNELFLRLVPAHHGWAFLKKAEERGLPAMPVAIAIGVDPAVYIASQFAHNLGFNEMEIAGGLRKKPVDVVKCKTIDVEVPAYAEIILECEMPLPPKTGTEGPFGEFTGHTSGVVENERIVKVKAVTHKANPIYQNIWLGKPPHEHLYINALTYAVPAYQDLKSKFPALKAAYAPPSGVSMKLVLQIDPKLKYPGMVNDLMLSSLGTNGGLWKEIIVVDDDTNIFENAEVDWAIITRAQPDRDMVIIPRCHAIFLDPSSPSPGITSKVFIDATKKEGFKAQVAEPAREMMESIQNKWAQYGFKVS